MIAYDCPIGRALCDGCNNLLTGGCLLKQSQPQLYSISNDMVAIWERRREELIKLSKEDLIEIIMVKENMLGLRLDNKE